jgi:hypothetical protein
MKTLHPIASNFALARRFRDFESFVCGGHAFAGSMNRN